MRRVLFLILALLASSTRAFATPAFVQASAWTNDGGASTCTIAAFNPSSGNNIIVLVAQTGSDATADYSVSDSVDGAYTEETAARVENTTREINFHRRYNVSSGSRTITVTQTNSATNFSCVAVEVSTAGGTSLTYDTSGSNTLTTTTSWAGSSVAKSTAAQVIVFAVGAMNGAPGAQTLGSGYTLVATPAGNHYAEYRVSASSLGSETGPWTTTNARSGPAALASFKESTGGGTSTGRRAMRGWGG